MNYVRIAGAIAIMAAIVVAIFLVRSCTTAPARRETAAARADTARSEGQVRSATDATAITGNAMSAAADTDQQTRENRDAIQKSGGDAAVWLRAMCARKAYEANPRCAK